MGKLRRRMLEWGLASLIIYYGVPPVASSLGPTGYLTGVTKLFFPKNEISVPAGDLEQRLPAGFVARDYLNVANGLSHAYKTEETEWCKELADSTFDNYRALVRHNGRDDLSPEVRFAADLSEMHIWLQVRENGTWVDYEPMHVAPRLKPEEVRSYSLRSRQERARFEAPVKQNLVSLPGTQIMVPDASIFRMGTPTFLAHAMAMADDARPYLKPEPTHNIYK